MIDSEKKKKLRKVLFAIDPGEGNEESIEAIEKFQKSLGEYSKSLEESRSSLKADMAAMRKEHKSNLDELERKSNSLIAQLSVSIKDSSKSHKQELGKTRDEFNQIVKEIRGQVSATYSKMGGATMPMLIQVEDAQFAPDGVTTVYYFKNLPTYIVVGGAILVNGDGYSNVVPLVDGYNITFDYPPQGATPNSPAQIPHNFHY